MTFKILLTASLLLTAGTSAYMAIYGLMQVFSQHSAVVGAMGAGMELGKILVVVYLHRGWYSLKTVHRFYYIPVVFLLVFLTSLEIFGFLAQSHSKTGEETALIGSTINYLEQEKALIGEELKTLEKTLLGLPETYVTKRFQFRKESGYDQKRRRLVEINSQLDKLQGDSIRSRLAAGPIFAVSRLIQIPDSTGIIVFIILLVGVVEPLSVGLTVAVSSQWKPKTTGKMSPEHKLRVEKRIRKGN